MEDLKKSMVKEEMDELKELSEKLTGLSHDVKPIQRTEFEYYLLPYLIGEVENNEVNSTVFINNYKDFAGGYKTALRVMDGEKVMFELPPIMLDIKIDGLEDISFRKMIIKYRNIAESNLRIADRDLGKTINETINGIKKDGDSNKELLKGFETMLEIYKDRVKNIEVSSVVKETEEFLDELEYD